MGGVGCSCPSCACGRASRIADSGLLGVVVHGAKGAGKGANETMRRWRGWRWHSWPSHPGRVTLLCQTDERCDRFKGRLLHQDFVAAARCCCRPPWRPSLARRYRLDGRPTCGRGAAVSVSGGTVMVHGYDVYPDPAAYTPGRSFVATLRSPVCPAAAQVEPDDRLWQRQHAIQRNSAPGHWDIQRDRGRGGQRQRARLGHWC